MEGLIFVSRRTPGRGAQQGGQSLQVSPERLCWDLLWGLQAAAEGVPQTGSGGDLVGSEVLQEGFRRVVWNGFYPCQVPHHSPSLHPETACWEKQAQLMFPAS